MSTSDGSHSAAKPPSRQHSGPVKPAHPPRPSASAATPAPTSVAARGLLGEDLALEYLQRQGMALVERNYRVAAGPSARAGEVDLIMRDRDGTLVFVEVRSRGRFDHGGAAASITRAKQAHIVYAARHYLQRRCRQWPPCRFDVVAIDGDTLTWLPAAFDAG